MWIKIPTQANCRNLIASVSVILLVPLDKGYLNFRLWGRKTPSDKDSTEETQEVINSIWSSNGFMLIFQNRNFGILRYEVIAAFRKIIRACKKTTLSKLLLDHKYGLSSIELWPTFHPMIAILWQFFSFYCFQLISVTLIPV